MGSGINGSNYEDEVDLGIALAIIVVTAAIAFREQSATSAAVQVPSAAGGATGVRSRPVLGPPIYHLDDRTMLRWPLPPSVPRYGKIDGFRLKPYVNHLIAIAEKSRTDGHQWWGRITGTLYYDETQDWIDQRLRSFGVETRRQVFELPPVWWPDSWQSIRHGPWAHGEAEDS